MTRVEQLLEKYWLCETTISEEEELRHFFLQQEVPGHLLKYKPMFELRQEEAKVALDERFDEKILGLIGTEERKTVRRFTLRPALRIAASVAIIASLWFSIQFYTDQQNNPWKQDTFETPEQALAEVQKILAMVSDKMEQGQELVIEKMEKAESLTQIIK